MQFKSEMIQAGAVALLLSAGVAGADIVMVDDFSAGEIDLSTRTASGSISDPVAQVLGGERELSWSIVANPFNSRLNLFAAFNDQPGFGIDMGVGNASVVELTYDGVGSDAAAAGLNFNANSFGVDRVVLSFLSIDLPVDVTIAIVDGNGNRGTLTRVLPAGTGNIESFVFDQFTFIGQGFDFSDIDRLDVSFNLFGQDPNRDLFLLNIGFEVPSPGPLALAGLGGLAIFRRRR